jgi:hypothetical protein
MKQAELAKGLPFSFHCRPVDRASDGLGRVLRPERMIKGNRL